MDADGNTNLILIGAPHYYEKTRGGQVSVCPLPRGVSEGPGGAGSEVEGARIFGLSLSPFSRGHGGSVKLFSTVIRVIPGVALGQP